MAKISLRNVLLSNAIYITVILINKTIGGELKEKCEAFVHPYIGIHERSQCYLFDSRDASGVTNLNMPTNKRCSHIDTGVRRSGMAMWMPMSVLYAASAIYGNPAEESYPVFGLFQRVYGDTDPDQFYFAREEDGRQKWTSKMTTNNLYASNLMKTVTSGDHDGERLCWMWDMKDKEFWIGTCNLTIAWGPIVCQYSDYHKRMVQHAVGVRLASSFIVEQSTLDTLIECLGAARKCDTCYSFAYNAQTGDCQIYIPDDRFYNWTPSLVTDSDYIMYTFDDVE